MAGDLILIVEEARPVASRAAFGWRNGPSYNRHRSMFEEHSNIPETRKLNR
jgi:hypothetical protein